MRTLVRAFDEKDCFDNVIVPLSLDIERVIYIYRHEILTDLFEAARSVIEEHKPIEVYFRLISSDEDVAVIFDTDDELLVDIGASRFLSIALLEKALSAKREIIYLDGEMMQIKTYREHRTIADHLFPLTISEAVRVNGGQIKSNMHGVVKSEGAIRLINELIERNLENYSGFTAFVSRIAKIVANGRNCAGDIVVGEEAIKRIKNDPVYRGMADLGVMELKVDRLRFYNNEVRSLFNVSGSFLENYIYLKLKDSGYFDDIIMSAVIDFSDNNAVFPVMCEIDCLISKDNHYLFVSCKSNKVSVDALNEIVVHNYMFGNEYSKAVMCTLDDLNVHSPVIYSKARELGVAVVDRTAFADKSLAKVFLSIIRGAYEYEALPDK